MNHQEQVMPAQVCSGVTASQPEINHRTQHTTFNEVVMKLGRSMIKSASVTSETTVQRALPSESRDKTTLTYMWCYCCSCGAETD